MPEVMASPSQKGDTGHGLSLVTEPLGYCLSPFPATKVLLVTVSEVPQVMASEVPQVMTSELPQVMAPSKKTINQVVAVQVYMKQWYLSYTPPSPLHPAHIKVYNTQTAHFEETWMV